MMFNNQLLRRFVIAAGLGVLVFTSTLFLAGTARAQEESESQNGPVLLVVNKSDDTVAFVDPETLEKTGIVVVGFGPHEVETSRNGRFAYVANYGGRGEEGGFRQGSSISVINVPERRVVSTIDLGEFRAPHGLAVSRDGRRLFVTVEGSKAVLEIDAASERISRIFATEERVSHMCVLTADETKLYIANLGSESVSVVNLKDGKVSRIVVGDGPEGIDASPRDGTIWVANRSSGDVNIIDAETDKSIATFVAGDVPIRLKFTPGGDRVLVSNFRGNEVAIFDARTRKKLGAIDTGERPIGLLVEPDGKHAWVAQTQADRVSKIDLETMKIVGHVSPGVEPDGLAWAAAASQGGSNQ